VLANEAFKVNKLVRYEKTEHNSLDDRSTDFFELKALMAKKNIFDSFGSYQKENLLPLKLHI
jgi:hypothetical protein